MDRTLAVSRDCEFLSSRLMRFFYLILAVSSISSHLTVAAGMEEDLFSTEVPSLRLQETRRRLARNVIENEKVVASDADSNNRFGSSVSVAGNVLVAGSVGDDISTAYSAGK